ncbi:MAG TPA: hypothetical protein VED37_01725, partial [Ktedonobacteraceae bacterium]|nr:hypothetical protein [Ktedonobacteraceae bacterium]
GRACDHGEDPGRRSGSTALARPPPLSASPRTTGTGSAPGADRGELFRLVVAPCQPRTGGQSPDPSALGADPCPYSAGHRRAGHWRVSSHRPPSCILNPSAHKARVARRGPYGEYGGARSLQ